MPAKREKRVENLILAMENAISPKTLELLNSVNKQQQEKKIYDIFYYTPGVSHAKL